MLGGVGRRKGGRCSCCRWTGHGHGQGIPTDLVCGGTLKVEVTFCQAARLPRQGMDPNANVGYRSCFVPSCGCSCCGCCLLLRSTLCAIAYGRYFTLLHWPPPPDQAGGSEAGTEILVYIYLGSYRTCCTYRYVSACRLSTLTLQPHTSTLTSASLECLA